MFVKKKSSELSKRCDVKKEYFYNILLRLDTCIVQFKNGGGIFSYIVPITSAITNQEPFVPTNIIGCFKIRGNNGNAVTIKPGSPILHKQIVLSLDSGQFNKKFLPVWKDGFCKWINSEEMQKRFTYKRNFCFGGFVNSFESPGYIGNYLLEGDAISLLKEMYEDVSLSDLAEDMVIPRAMFGAELSRDEVLKILMPDVAEFDGFEDGE